MSEVINLEKLGWRLEALEKKMDEEAATRYFVRETVQAATSPINEAIVKMERTLEKMGEQIEKGHENQSILMKERADREKAEFEARMQRQAEKHEAEMQIASANLEEAKNQTLLNRITKQWHPIVLFAGGCALVFNQIILPAIHAMQTAGK